MQQLTIISLSNFTNDALAHNIDNTNQGKHSVLVMNIVTVQQMECFLQTQTVILNVQLLSIVKMWSNFADKFDCFIDKHHIQTCAHNKDAMQLAWQH